MQQRCISRNPRSDRCSKNPTSVYIRIPITTIEGRRLWDAVDILLDNLEDVAGAWIIYDDDSDKHLIFYPADKPQDFDLNCNSAYEACESVNDILSDLYQIRGTGSFTTLPTEREPTKWSAGYCRLVALAVGDAQYKLWEIKSKFHPRSDSSFRDMIFSRDIEWAEKTSPDVILSGHLNSLSDSLFSLKYWLCRRYI